MSGVKDFPEQGSNSENVHHGGKSSSRAVPKAAKLVPFLRKVQLLCENAPPHVARWSADGKQFDVLDPKGFEDLLRVYFEGATPQTFHRQLFFYGWVKLNHANGGGDEKTKGTWSFRHPNFLRDEPSKIYEIKRYARAADRDEQEEGDRVDVLERRVSALQSLVDDLSRKLAAVQLTLERTPIAVGVPVPEEPVVTKPSRKRMKDIDEDFLSDDLRISDDDLLALFEEEEAAQMLETETESETNVDTISLSNVSSKAAQARKIATKSTDPKEFSLPTDEAKAHEFLQSIMSTPQFQAVLTSTIQEQAQAQAKKVEVLPHLRVC